MAAESDPMIDDENKYYAASAEARAEIEALSDLDHAKLVVIARYFHKVRLTHTVHSAEDLLQEAIVRTLSGHRRWRRGVTMLKHLDRTMESISGNLNLEDRMPRANFVTAEMEEESIPLDEYLARKEELAEVKTWFSKDPLALNLLIQKAVGMTPSEIQENLGIGSTEYETVLRRIRRTLARQIAAKGEMQ